MKTNYMYLDQDTILVKTTDLTIAGFVCKTANTTFQIAQKANKYYYFCIINSNYLEKVKETVDMILLAEPTFTIDNWSVNQLVTFACSLKMSLNNPVLVDIHENLKEWHEKVLKKLTVRE